jgi:hypothetical protein
MAHIVRRTTPELAHLSHLDPLQIMRDLTGWDPFREMTTLAPFVSRPLAGFAPQFDCLWHGHRVARDSTAGRPSESSLRAPRGRGCLAVFALPSQPLAQRRASRDRAKPRHRVRQVGQTVEERQCVDRFPQDP